MKQDERREILHEAKVTIGFRDDPLADSTPFWRARAVYFAEHAVRMLSDTQNLQVCCGKFLDCTIVNCVPRLQHEVARLKEVLSEREETVPDFEEDFEGAVEAICDQVVDDLKKHPEPEYWIAKSAARLAHFVKIKAPNFIIEGEKRLLQRRVTALPVYCPDYDALKSEAGGG